MCIMLEYETNNASLVTAHQTLLPPVPSKTPPLPHLPGPTPVPTIAAAAVGTLAAAFLALFTKVQLNSILNRKWNSPIYSSGATLLEGRDAWPDLPNERISALVETLSNWRDAPLDDPKSELDYHTNMIALGNHWFVFECSGKSCTVNPSNDCLGTFKDVPIINSAIDYDWSYSNRFYILLFRNDLYLTMM